MKRYRLVENRKVVQIQLQKLCSFANLSVTLLRRLIHSFASLHFCLAAACRFHFTQTRVARSLGPMFCFGLLLAVHFGQTHSRHSSLLEHHFNCRQHRLLSRWFVVNNAASEGIVQQPCTAESNLCQHTPLTKLDPFQSVQCSAPIPRGKSSAKDRHRVVHFTPTSPSPSLNVTSSSTYHPHLLNVSRGSLIEAHTYIHNFVDDNCWAELYSHRQVQRRALLPPR